MSDCTRFYECVFIVRRDLSTQDAHGLCDKYCDTIESMNGKIIKKEYWGLRNLAYEIKKNKKGHYIFFIFEGLNSIVARLDKEFKISEDVIKFLIMHTDHIDDKPSMMMQIPSNSR